jgi:hypothetical protein
MTTYWLIQIIAAKINLISHMYDMQIVLISQETLHCTLRLSDFKVPTTISSDYSSIHCNLPTATLLSYDKLST